MEPFIYGDYPGSMKRLVEDRLPKFTEDERKVVKGATISPPSYTSDSLANETGGGIREF